MLELSQYQTYCNVDQMELNCYILVTNVCLDLNYRGSYYIGHFIFILICITRVDMTNMILI